MLLTVVAFWTATVSICAQNNPYKIRDDLFAIYEKAYENRRIPQGLHLADSLYHRATIEGDKKAQCLALTIHFLYHFFRTDYAAFEKAGRVLQEKALQTGYVQYFYFVMTNKVTWLMNNGKQVQAIQYVKDMQKYAEEHHHTYGIYAGYRSLGLVQMERGDVLQAIQSYRSALEFGLENLPNQDMSQNYRNIAECYRYMENYELMLENVDKGLEIVKSVSARTILLQNRCFALFMLNRDKEFLELLPSVEKLTGPISGANTNIVEELHIFKKILEGDNDGALKDIDKIKSIANRLRLYVIYYTRCNNYKMAMSYYRQSVHLRDQIAEKVSREDLADMNARYNNRGLEIEKQKMAYQKAQLELSYTQLSLENSSLELNKTKASEHLAKLNADNYLLSLNNKQLETKQLRNLLAAQKAQRELKEQEVETQNKMVFVLLFVAGIIFLLTAAYVYYIRRASKKLKTLNCHLRHAVTELSVAKEKALQADKMKTLFIQNMSHEIRTPLNAIVGFTQVLIEMDENLDKEEKQEMGKCIADNSDLLSTLINDILDLTSLESGKYVMKMEPVNVTDLCHQALKTVMHRKAPDVELKFYADVANDFVINTDDTRVMQVLINMLTNAEKNTTEGSITLSCSLYAHPGYLTFSVADTGIGIPKGKAKEIFERFKKLDQYKQGTGLGLNICRMIAEKLDGDIYVDENYTDGARFVFTVKL